jgi:hypothetical protein
MGSKREALGLWVRPKGTANRVVIVFDGIGFIPHSRARSDQLPKAADGSSILFFHESKKCVFPWNYNLFF